APATFGYASSFFAGPPDGASITKVTLIRTGSVTHAFDMNQRISKLTFGATSGGLNVNAPSDPNLAPPGYYMLFILNSNGVPSVAKIVQLGSASPTPTPTPSPSPSPTITPTPTPAPGAATMLSPVPGSTFTSSTVTFNWS